VKTKTPLPGFRLIDGEERRKAHPTTWHMPSLAERQAVKPGDWVKVGLEDIETGQGERFWINVVSVTDDGVVIGKVSNQLTRNFGLDLNDLLRIERRHMLMVLTRKEMEEMAREAKR
jgi:hypothetical protein